MQRIKNGITNLYCEIHKYKEKDLNLNLGFRPKTTQKTHKINAKIRNLNNYSIDHSLGAVGGIDKDPEVRNSGGNFEDKVNFCGDLGRGGLGLRGKRGLEKILKIKGKSVKVSSPKVKERKIINDADELEFKISDRNFGIPQNRINALGKFSGQQSELLMIRPIKKTKNLTGSFESFHTNDAPQPPSTTPPTSYRKSKIEPHLAQKLRQATTRPTPKSRFRSPNPSPPTKRPYDPISQLTNKDEILKYFQIHKIDTSQFTRKNPPYDILSIDS
jgi:hypothetical protein